MTDARRPRTAGRRRGRRSWVRRATAAVGVVVLALVLAVGLSLWSLDRSIQRVDVEGLGQDGPDGAAEAEAEADGGDDGVEALETGSEGEPLTVLVIGSDSREELTPEERRRLGTGDAPGDRAEVITLARLDPAAEQVRLLNVPRDSYVELCDGSYGKVNAAVEVGEADGRGGLTCTVQTITSLLEVSIDHVVRVDFGGFVDIIDELGGVSMHLDQPLHDDEAHLDLPAGCVELDGRDALAFVRARHIDDDYGRIARQHRLIEELRAELTDLGVLGNLPRALRVAQAVARSLEFDSSLDIGRLQQLVREHRSTVAGDIDGRALPGESGDVDGAWVLELDEQRADELVTWLLTGEDPADATGTGTTDGPQGVDAGDAVDAVDAGGSDAGGDERREPSDGPRTLSGEEPVGGEPTAPGEDC